MARYMTFHSFYDRVGSGHGVNVTGSETSGLGWLYRQTFTLWCGVLHTVLKDEILSRCGDRYTLTCHRTLSGVASVSFEGRSVECSVIFS